MLIFLLCFQHLTNITSAPHVYIVNATEKDTWELRTTAQRTVISIHRVASLHRGFTVTVNGQTTEYSDLNIKNTIQVLDSPDSILKFNDMANGTYEVVAVGLNNECGGGLYVSNLNGVPTETKSFFLGNFDLCFFSAGFPINKIVLDVFFPFSGYVLYYESDQKEIRMSPKTTRSNERMIIEKRNVTSPVLIRIAANTFRRVSPKVNSISYDTNEVRQADFPCGFSTDFSGFESLNRQIMIYILIGVACMLVILIIMIVFLVKCTQYKRKRRREDDTNPYGMNYIDTNYQVTECASNYESPQIQGNEELNPEVKEK